MGTTAQFAASRLFHVAGAGWYFEAREGRQGPYLSRAEAEQQLACLRQRGPARQQLWDEAERAGRASAQPTLSLAPRA